MVPHWGGSLQALQSAIPEPPELAVKGQSSEAQGLEWISRETRCLPGTITQPKWSLHSLGKWIKNNVCLMLSLSHIPNSLWPATWGQVRAKHSILASFSPSRQMSCSWIIEYFQYPLLVPLITHPVPLCCLWLPAQTRARTAWSKSTNSGVSQPWFESQLCHLLAVWHWVIYLISLSLNLLFCKIGKMTIAIS